MKVRQHAQRQAIHVLLPCADCIAVCIAACNTKQKFQLELIGVIVETRGLHLAWTTFRDLKL